MKKSISILLAVLLLLGPAHQVGIDEEVVEQRLEHVGVGLGPDLLDELVPAGIFVVDDIIESLPLGGQRLGAGKLVYQVHDLGHVVHGVLVQIIEHLGQTIALQTVRDLHPSVSFLLPFTA